jgi:hypothetical protein
MTTKAIAEDADWTMDAWVRAFFEPYKKQDYRCAHCNGIIVRAGGPAHFNDDDDDGVQPITVTITITCPEPESAGDPSILLHCPYCGVWNFDRPW